MNESLMTAENCASWLECRPSGELFWKRGRHAGKKAGCVNGVSGYIQVGIDGFSFKAHRLVWLLHHGRFPAKFIDHVNCIAGDNRIENLREATPKINAQNRRLPAATKSAEKLGVVFRKGKWNARITIDRQVCHIGTFDTCDEAFDAYVAVKRRVHEGCTL